MYIHPSHDSNCDGLSRMGEKVEALQEVRHWIILFFDSILNVLPARISRLLCNICKQFGLRSGQTLDPTMIFILKM